MKDFFLIAAFLSTCLCAGCGDGRPKVVPVSGQVLIDGEPLTHGFVRFAPPDSRVAIGRLDKDGHFRLTSFESGDGAVTGQHRIAIKSHEPVAGSNKIKWHAPRKYSNYSSSGLTQEITKATDSIVIELTWGDRKRKK